MLTISETAALKIKEVIQEEANPDLKLRIFVQGGGCSGFQYGFTLDEIQNEDDFSIDSHGVSVLVDSMSIQYLQGAEINYTNDISGSQFTIKNPNAETTCGCGSSFSASSHYDYDEV
jgi:iron-sulfur cluster insertion protein